MTWQQIKNRIREINEEIEEIDRDLKKATIKLLKSAPVVSSEILKMMAEAMENGELTKDKWNLWKERDELYAQLYAKIDEVEADQNLDIKESPDKTVSRPGSGDFVRNTSILLKAAIRAHRRKDQDARGDLFRELRECGMSPDEAGRVLDDVVGVPR